MKKIVRPVLGKKTYDLFMKKMPGKSFEGKIKIALALAPQKVMVK